ncbi:unnamed protein product [Gordionus sp. m RMFG-2023]|uniref:uncharacterized protein LOC135926103 isoform X2 n=1 Tax=Gordionus sp. m RMFG-2023 TaxID=3053472 RepID=UPI0030DE6D13
MVTMERIYDSEIVNDFLCDQKGKLYEKPPKHLDNQIFPPIQDKSDDKIKKGQKKYLKNSSTNFDNVTDSSNDHKPGHVSLDLESFTPFQTNCSLYINQKDESMVEKSKIDHVYENSDFKSQQHGLISINDDVDKYPFILAEYDKYRDNSIQDKLDIRKKYCATSNLYHDSIQMSSSTKDSIFMQCFECHFKTIDARELKFHYLTSHKTGYQTKVPKHLLNNNNEIRNKSKTNIYDRKGSAPARLFNIVSETFKSSHSLSPSMQPKQSLYTTASFLSNEKTDSLLRTNNKCFYNNIENTKRMLSLSKQESLIANLPQINSLSSFTNDDKLKCFECSFTTPAKHVMIKHYNAVHSSLWNTFNCFLCEKSSKTRPGITRHIYEAHLSILPHIFDHDKNRLLKPSLVNTKKISRDIMGNPPKKDEYNENVHSTMNCQTTDIDQNSFGKYSQSYIELVVDVLRSIAQNLGNLMNQKNRDNSYNQKLAILVEKLNFNQRLILHTLVERVLEYFSQPENISTAISMHTYVTKYIKNNRDEDAITNAKNIESFNDISKDNLMDQQYAQMISNIKSMENSDLGNLINSFLSQDFRQFSAIKVLKCKYLIRRINDFKSDNYFNYRTYLINEIRHSSLTHKTLNQKKNIYRLRIYHRKKSVLCVSASKLSIPDNEESSTIDQDVSSIHFYVKSFSKRSDRIKARMYSQSIKTENLNINRSIIDPLTSKVKFNYDNKNNMFRDNVMDAIYAHYLKYKYKFFQNEIFDSDLNNFTQNSVDQEPKHFLIENETSDNLLLINEDKLSDIGDTTKISEDKIPQIHKFNNHKSVPTTDPNHISNFKAHYPKLYVCPFRFEMSCSFQTRNKKRWADHLDHHKGLKSHKCSICHYKTTWYENLNQHIKRMHAGQVVDKLIVIEKLQTSQTSQILPKIPQIVRARIMDKYGLATKKDTFNFQQNLDSIQNSKNVKEIKLNKRKSFPAKFIGKSGKAFKYLKNSFQDNDNEYDKFYNNDRIDKIPPYSMIDHTVEEFEDRKDTSSSTSKLGYMSYLNYSNKLKKRHFTYPLSKEHKFKQTVVNSNASLDTIKTLTQSLNESSNVLNMNKNPKNVKPNFKDKNEINRKGIIRNFQPPQISVSSSLSQVPPHPYDLVENFVKTGFYPRLPFLNLSTINENLEVINGKEGEECKNYEDRYKVYLEYYKQCFGPGIINSIPYDINSNDTSSGKHLINKEDNLIKNSIYKSFAENPSPTISRLDTNLNFRERKNSSSNLSIKGNIYSSPATLKDSMLDNGILNSIAPNANQDILSFMNTLQSMYQQQQSQQQNSSIFNPSNFPFSWPNYNYFLNPQLIQLYNNYELSQEWYQKQQRNVGNFASPFSNIMCFICSTPLASYFEMVKHLEAYHPDFNFQNMEYANRSNECNFEKERFSEGGLYPNSLFPTNDMQFPNFATELLKQVTKSHNNDLVHNFYDAFPTVRLESNVKKTHKQQTHKNKNAPKAKKVNYIKNHSKTLQDRKTSLTSEFSSESSAVNHPGIKGECAYNDETFEFSGDYSNSDSFFMYKNKIENNIVIDSSNEHNNSFHVNITRIEDGDLINLSISPDKRKITEESLRDRFFSSVNSNSHLPWNIGPEVSLYQSSGPKSFTNNYTPDSSTTLYENTAEINIDSKDIHADVIEPKFTPNKDDSNPSLTNFIDHDTSIETSNIPLNLLNNTHAVSGGTKRQRTHRCTLPGCNFEAYDKNRMLDHLAAHRGEKPHGCPYCEFRTSWRFNIKNHIRSKHPTML